MFTAASERSAARKTGLPVISCRVRLILRILIAGLIAAAIGVASVPLLVVLDIREGGDGWGLCAEGFDGCRTTYFAGFEFVAVIIGLLFGILALVAACVRMLRWLNRHTARKRLELGLPV